MTWYFLEENYSSGGFFIHKLVIPDGITALQ
jgi:hypothetical protein